MKCCRSRRRLERRGGYQRGQCTSEIANAPILNGVNSSRIARTAVHRSVLANTGVLRDEPLGAARSAPPLVLLSLRFTPDVVRMLWAQHGPRAPGFLNQS